MLSQDFVGQVTNSLRDALGSANGEASNNGVRATCVGEKCHKEGLSPVEAAIQDLKILLGLATGNGPADEPSERKSGGMPGGRCKDCESNLAVEIAYGALSVGAKPGGAKAVKKVAAAATGAKPAAEQAARGAGAAATKVARGAFSRLKHASDYGIKPYSELKRRTRGKGLEVHHLYEKRFAPVLNVKEDSMLSIVLTEREHRKFTKAWRRAIPYGKDGTFKATPEQVQANARKIYKRYPEILEALGLNPRIP
jgi:hypothetical protein